MAVGVVTPAHNQEHLLPACRAAHARAAAQLRQVPVHLVVVADGEDGKLAAGWVASTLPASILLLTTDADCRLASLAGSADLLRRAGWHAVVGPETVLGWSEHPPGFPPIFLERYDPAVGEHPHVHGASMGFAGLAYLSAGGFAANKTAEDHAWSRPSRRPAVASCAQAR